MKEDSDDELEMEQMTPPSASPQQPTPLATATATATPSPNQPTALEATTTTTTTSVALPQLEDDDDLLELFHDITSPDHLWNDDLFLVTGARLKAKLVAFAKRLESETHSNRLRFYNNLVPKECAVKDITTMPKDPCLNGKHGIPMSVPALTEVAQALLNLSADVQEMLQLPKHSGAKGSGKRLVAMVPSTDKQRLHCNAKNWMGDVINNATTDESSAFDITSVLMRALRSFEPLAFDAAASDAPQVWTKLKLDAKLQQAMVFAADLRLSQVRTVKKHLCHSNLDILQPETVTWKLQVSEFVKPTSIEFKDGGRRKRPSWCAPIDKLLKWKTDQKLEANAIDHAHLDKAHVILVGDQGQGAFRMMATLLLITKPRRRDGRRHAGVNMHLGTMLALEADGLCGHIQCKKDTHQVLKDTIASPVNDSPLKIKEAKRITTCREQGGKQNLKLHWGNLHTQQGDVLAMAAVELFMVGDLAFHSLMLGKESMAPHWCWRCPQAKKSWSSVNAKRDRLPNWTLEGLALHLDKLESGELDKTKPEQRLGVTQPALTCIPPKNSIVPALHNNKLFINAPIDLLIAWINH